MKENADLTGLSVLIVEDDALLRSQVSAYLEKLGADVTGAKDIGSAKRLASDLSFDFVLLDVNLPDGLGTDLLKEKTFSAGAGIIIMTAGGCVAGAVEAMQLGASDYLVKPFDIRELPLVIGRARRSKRSARLDEHRRATDAGNRGDFYFGPSLGRLQSQLEKILASDRRIQTELPPVLIVGETGTGKSTIARWIHNQGPRSTSPLVEVNCSALPEQLAESELFGHERGAFTDARTARMGLFEAANGGTLFLDELPSLSLPLQAKLLTAIEDRVVRRLGGNKPIPVDARLIVAANCDLQQLVAEKRFREDLFHRLDLWRLSIPPLRDRGEDILRLATQLLEHLCRRHRVSVKRIHPDGAARLLRYRWPGNVRELSHELERAIVFDENDELSFAHLPRQSKAAEPPESKAWFEDGFQFPPGFSLEEAIQRAIQHALKQTDQNVSAASRLLGVPRDYVRYRLEKKNAHELQTA